MKTLKEKAQNEIKSLRENGFDNEQIKDFLQDGEALEKEGYTDQELVEEMYKIVTSTTVKEKLNIIKNWLADKPEGINGQCMYRIGRKYITTVQMWENGKTYKSTIADFYQKHFCLN